MIYRFKSKLETHDRIGAFVIGVPGTEKKPLPSGPKTYESRFHAVQALDNGWKVCEAPEYEIDRSGVSIVIVSGKENETFPDLWGFGLHLFCSDKFRNILQQQDQMRHQFIPFNFLNEDFTPIPKEKKYYWFHPRRIVSTTEEMREPNNLNFFPIPQNENFLSEITVNKKLYSQIQKLPVCRFSTGQAMPDRLSGLFSVLYLNKGLVNACMSANISGLNKYTVKYGIGEESLCPIRCREGVIK